MTSIKMIHFFNVKYILSFVPETLNLKIVNGHWC
jgi:hypothetical protein